MSSSGIPSFVGHDFPKIRYSQVSKRDVSSSQATRDKPLAILGTGLACVSYLIWGYYGTQYRVRLYPPFGVQYFI